MKPDGVYSLKREQLTAERQQAVIRLLLSLVTSVVLIKFYISQGPQSIPGYQDTPKILTQSSDASPQLTLSQVVTIISLFAAYSIGVWTLIKWCPKKIAATKAFASLAEIILITYLFATTSWTGIPFYLWYFFYVVSMSSRYGSLHSILALSASVVSFTWVAYMVRQANSTDSVLILGFTCFLLVLGMMIGQISEKQHSYQARLAVVDDFRAELAGLATPKDIINLLIERTGGFLNAEQVFFLPAKRGADGSDDPGLRSAGATPMLLAAFREDGGMWNVEEILHEQHPLMSNRLTSINPLPKGKAAELGIKNLAAAPLIVRGASVGVLYAANRRDRSIRKSDLQILELVAAQAGPVVENALLWERLTEAATSEERARIARDLHDNFLQTLAAIKFHLERCKILIEKDSERAKDGIDKIHQIATRGLAEVRYYLSELRIMGPEPSRFREAIKRYADEASVKGEFELYTDIRVPESPIPPGVAVIAFQIARELLNNVVSHAQAKHVSVKVSTTDAKLMLEIEDDGVGFEMAKARSETGGSDGHLGIIGIEERARQASGDLTITSEPGKGTKAVVSLAI